jgi:O-antigen/teichoic acid export membrane protein
MLLVLEITQFSQARFVMKAMWFRRWIIRIASVSGSQTVAQMLNGIVGFVLIRTMPKEEFAWFSISTGIAAVLSALNDGGIASAVIANGGSVWQDRQRFSALIEAAFAWLCRTATVSAAVISPILFWLLYEKGASSVLAGMACILVVGPQWIATSTVILGAVNRLHSRVWQMQAVELTGAFTRAAFTLIPALLGWVNLTIALSAVALSTGAQAILVRRQVRPLLNAAVPPEDQLYFHKRIRGTLNKMYPNAVFGCIQGQLALGLLAVFGSTGEVADFGAIARLGFISSFLSAPLSSLFAPAFARLSDPSRLSAIFLRVLSTYVVVLSAFIGTVYLKADLILGIFGIKYYHLEVELVLMAVSLAVGLVNQIFWCLNMSRGWVRWLWLNIPLTLLSQVVATLLFDVDSVRGVIWLSFSTSVPALFLGIAIAAGNIHTHRSIAPK